MENIKFRAFDQDMMVYQDTSPTMGGLDAGDMLQRFEQLNIMQFTGLKDKNGKEIYEGDILKMLGYFTHEVVFVKGCFGYIPDLLFGFIPLATNTHLEWDENNQSEHVEIVGNIHETPHLLDSDSYKEENK